MYRELVRTWKRDGFVFKVYDLNERQPPNHHRMGVKLYDRRRLVYFADDFGCPQTQTVDGQETLLSLLSFTATMLKTEAAIWSESERAETFVRLVDELRTMEEHRSDKSLFCCGQSEEPHDFIDCVDCYTDFGSNYLNRERS